MSDDNELKEYREAIDKADREIVRLLLHRAENAAKIGKAKRTDGSPVYRPDREKDVYANIRAMADEYGDDRPLTDKVLLNIYREVMSGTIALENGPSIAVMGPRGSFSHGAALSRFGSSLHMEFEQSIPSVFRIVSGGRDARYGVVPVDNTTEGSVGITMDMLLRHDLKIYAEMYLRIDQNLLYHKNIETGAVKRLYTNRIAMEQCREWISINIRTGDLEVIETESTARAAERAASDRDGAAIASLAAAEEYNLVTLARSIQDSPNNLTRFLVIGEDQCRPTGDDKTSIICAVGDSPGSLCHMLRPFEKNNISLNRIESRASRRDFGEYYFFIDFNGHSSDELIRGVLDEVTTHSSYLKLLGSYPRAEMP